MINPVLIFKLLTEKLEEGGEVEPYTTYTLEVLSSDGMLPTISLIPSRLRSAQVSALPYEDDPLMMNPEEPLKEDTSIEAEV